MIATQPKPANKSQTAREGIVDSDVHVFPHSLDEIRDYMPMPWRDRYRGGGVGSLATQCTAIAWMRRRPKATRPVRTRTFCANS